MARHLFCLIFFICGVNALAQDYPYASKYPYQRERSASNYPYGYYASEYPYQRERSASNYPYGYYASEYPYQRERSASNYPYGYYASEYPYQRERSASNYPYGYHASEYPYGSYPYNGYGSTRDESRQVKKAFVVSATQCSWTGSDATQVVGYRLKNCGPDGDHIVCGGTASCNISMQVGSGKTIDFTASLSNVMCVSTQRNVCPDANSCVVSGGFLEAVSVEQLMQQRKSLGGPRLPVDKETH